MIVIYLLYGLAFFSLGLTASLHMLQGSSLPLRNHLPWLAAFGFACAATGWLDMLLLTDLKPEAATVVQSFRTLLQPVSGLLLLIFGWRILTKVSPLPAWTQLIPGLLLAPLAFVITYAATTFITPSPIEIPIDIWSRYLLYLPGSIMAGIGFLRQWRQQRKRQYYDVARLMLAAGVAFLFEAFVVGLVVPAAPYGPASYYNYDRTVPEAFTADQSAESEPFGLINWLDDDRVLEVTGLPIQFWRMLSAFAVTFFVVQGLGVFDALRKRELAALQAERDRAQLSALTAYNVARETAESWTEVLINIGRRIAELDDVDEILGYTVANGCHLLASDFMGLAIVNADQTDLELKYYADGSERTARLVETPVKVKNRCLLQTLQGAKSFCSADNEPPEHFADLHLFTPPGAEISPMRALAAVPLSLDNKPIGVLWVSRHENAPYSETDLIWLECLADQAVIAIQHGLMTSQLQSFSIVEERGRIAREMHDGLAQVLGYLNLQVQTLETLHKRGKEEALEAELAQMKDAVRTAHADVRENILSLRTTLANEKGLISAIDEYLNEFGLQTRIQTSFVHTVDEPVDLASLAEVQLVCILQESLTNVRKHANARRVSVKIEQVGRERGESILMEVRDDGAGFTQSNGSRSFGLQTMHERARAVGGTLIVQSTPGAGTVITCSLPCLQSDNLKRKNPLFSYEHS
ncbi:MAG: GAF domain-containing protein [Caldilineaceae bacterium]|nr:GAF domain-containing protein [Caldilineaceae bacterium]